ncbi:MAG: hypothetical protein IJT65_01585, partial [Eubacterium sp.]|nr:hypothetical protein [Eubacterium sp.]
PLTKQNSDELLFANSSDKGENFEYNVQFSRAKTDNAGNQVIDNNGAPVRDTLNLSVTGKAVARNYTKLGATAPESTDLGVKSAILNTFQEDSEYISMPNLKPYFTRQINRSVRNATKTKEELGSSTAGDRNIKQAVDTKGKEYQDIIKAAKNKYATGTDDEGNTTYEYTYQDRKYDLPDYADDDLTDDQVYEYSSHNDYTKKDKTLLFTQKRESESGGLTYYYSLDEDGNKVYDNRHTTFKGYDLYDGDYLKTPQTFIQEFYDAHLNPNMGHKDFGGAAVGTFYNTVVAQQYFAKNDSFNAVANKKTEIENDLTNQKKSYKEKEKTVKDDIVAVEKPDVPENASEESVEPTKSFDYPTDYNPLFLGTGSINVNGESKSIGSSGARATYNSKITSMSVSASTNIKTYGMWGWTSNFSGTGDDWQHDFTLKYNTTAAGFITELDSYRSNWNTYAASADWDGNPADKIIICNNDGSLRAFSGTEGLRKGDYYKVLEPKDGSNVVRARYFSWGMKDRNESKITCTSGDDFYKVNGNWANDGGGEHGIESKGFYVGKSMRFRTTGYMYTQNKKALVMAQNAGVITEGADGNGYGLRVDTNIDMGSNSFLICKNKLDVGVDNGSDSGYLRMSNNSIVICDGQLWTRRDIELGENCVLICNGDLLVDGTVTLGKNAKIICRGNASVIKGNVSVTEEGSAICAKNLTIQGWLVNTRDVTCTGSLTVQGTFNGSGEFSGRNNFSIYNLGNIFCGGTISANGTVLQQGGNLYTLANLSGANTTGDDSNIIEIRGSNTKVFIRGAITSSASGGGKIWIEDDSVSSNVTLSVLGNGYSECGNSKLVKFQNNANSSSVYFGKSLTVNGGGFYNKGRMYVFGNLTLSNISEATYTTSNTSYVDGNISATGTTLTVNGGHKLFVRGQINVLKLVVDGSSTWVHSNQVTAGDCIVITDGAYLEAITGATALNGVTTSGGGTLHGPQTVSIADNTPIQLNGIAHYIYIPEGGTLTVPSVNINDSVLKIVGNLKITGTGDSFNLTGNSKLYVTGNIEYGGIITVTKSKLYADRGIGKDGGLTPTSINLNDKSTILCRNDIDATTLASFTISTLQAIANWFNAYRSNIYCNGPINANGSSYVYAEGRITAKSVSAINSEVCGFYAVDLKADCDNRDNPTTGKFVSDGNKGLIFCGEKSSTGNNAALIAAGQFYYPTSTINFDRFNIGSGGFAVIQGNAKFMGRGGDYKSGVKEDFSIGSNGYCYVKGISTFENCFINTSGKMYLVGGINYGNATKRGRVKTNDVLIGTDEYTSFCDADFLSGSDSYIGPVQGSDTFTFNSQYEARGNVYFESNLRVDGYIPNGDKELDTTSGNPGFPNRGVTVWIPSGNTFVSGSVTTCNDNAFFIKQSGGLIMKDNLTMGCAIYNYGKLIIGNRFNLQTTTWSTDKKEQNKQQEGISLKNGEYEGDTNATFYVGAQNNPIYFVGVVKNAGKVYMNSALSVNGYTTIGEASQDFAYVNYQNAQTHINGDLRCNSNQIINKGYGKVGVSGKLTYGMCAYNCGEFYVTGDITNNEADGETTRPSAKAYRNKDNSFSFMNGLFKIDAEVVDGSYRYPQATVYCGGTMQFGYQVDNGGPAGSMVNIGEVYVRNDLLVYTFDQTVENGAWYNVFSGGGLLSGIFGKKNSYFYTAYLAGQNSQTFVGRNFHGGSGVAIGNGSIFMCGGDYKSSRATKLGANVDFRKAGFNILNIITTSNVPVMDYDDTDLYGETYFYCGGNLIANSFGKANYQWGSNLYQVPMNASRDFDIYSNTNMYVGGSFFANSKVYMKKNVTLQVAGVKDFYVRKSLIRTIFEAFTNPTAAANIIGLLDQTDYRFFVYQAFDENENSRITANGSAYVKDTAKIRDMTQNYFYGNFRCTDYVELGKAIDGVDETEAKEARFRTPRELAWIANHSEQAYLDDYKFSNSTYMYVGGNYESGGRYNLITNLLFAKSYTKIFASATLRADGDVVSNKYITLRHDAKLIANGRVLADTDIDAGSYSNIICAGDLKAKLGKMKIRDQTTVAVGGNATALSYIELGKAGDFVRTDKTLNKVNALEGGEAKYEGEEGEKSGDSTEGSQDNNTSGGNDDEQGEVAEPVKDSNGNPITDENGNYVYPETLNTSTELTDDTSDPALGGDMFIAGSLLSYTGYIKEFAFSFVSVGGVVFTPKYVTLRHNADMWILPELYSLYGDKDNKTYVYEPYHPTSDGSIWGDIKDFFLGAAYNIKEEYFTAHDGTLYTMGELTLNRNASLLGTYDCQVLGQCVLRQDTLIYLGHDFNCNAPSVNLSLDALFGNESVVGFDSYGSAGLGWRYTCKNYEKHDGYYYNMTVRDTEKPTSGYVKCDVCGAAIPASEAVKCQVSYPAVVYAYNNIDISTTIQMRMTYIVANKGNANIRNVYTQTENAERNAKELPNAICSYLGHITYFGMYSKLGALFYAPTKSQQVDTHWLTGNKTKVESITLDGFYNEIWGCILGDTVDMSSYYLKLHRFENWRTMDLHVVESGNVFIIPQKKYDDAAPNVDDIYLDERYRVQNTELESEGARQFFIPGEYIPHSVTSH